MLRRLRYFFWFFLLLLLFFLFQRVVFVVYQLDQSGPISYLDFFFCNYHALVLDVAAISYMLSIPVILWSVLLWTGNSQIKKWIGWYVFVILLMGGFIHIVDLGLYAEWGTKISHKALANLAYPREALASTLSSPVWLLLLILIVETAVVLYIYRKWVHPCLSGGLPLFARIVLPFLLMGLLFMGSRGGVQKRPVKKGDVYFSNNPMLNQASANSFWCFINVMASNNDVLSGNYRYMPDVVADSLVSRLLVRHTDGATPLFTLPHPNIVVVLMESFSAEAVGAFGGVYEATPNLDSLAAAGLINTAFYASGFRTDQGVVAIESGFPAQPTTSIMQQYGKFEMLPSLASRLVKAGYQTAFFSAGDNGFSNTDAYLVSAGYQRLYGGSDMHLKRKVLFGGYDDELFDFQLKETGKAHQPFYHLMATIVSHEPFDAEVPKIRHGGGLLDHYINTIHFTDMAIGDFIRKARLQPWYPNTVFIFMADHAHRLPLNRKAWEVLRHKIPFIVYGEPLKKEWRGVVMKKSACQTDFPIFMCAQLGLPDDGFIWGSDFMNERADPVAIFTFDDGIGLIKGDTSLIFRNDNRSAVIEIEGEMKQQNRQQMINQAKALLQKITKQYDDLGG